MNKKINDIKEQIIMVIFVYLVIIVLHSIFSDKSIENIVISAIISFLMVIISIILKNLISKPNLPGFAWGTLVSFLLTLPISPLQEIIVNSLSAFSFSLVGLPLLAFAGISVGEQLDVLKKMSWKIVIISIIVMASTYFGSAVVSQIILSLNGLI